MLSSDMVVLAAAFVAGVFSLLSLILAKESKISEFRRGWIEKGRELFGLFVSSAEALRTGEREDEKFTGALRNYHMFLLHIRLRMKADKDTLCNVEAEALAVKKLISKPSADESELSGHIKNLHEHVRKLLTSEWKRVKKGEPVYRIVRGLLMLFLCLTLGYAVFTALSCFPLPLRPPSAPAEGAVLGHKMKRAPTEGVPPPNTPTRVEIVDPEASESLLFS